MTLNRSLHPIPDRIRIGASGTSLYHSVMDLMAEIACDELLDLACDWLCRRRERTSHNNVGEVGYNADRRLPPRKRRRRWAGWRFATHTVTFKSQCEDDMTDTDATYKKIELVGKSPKSFSEAVANAVNKAAKTLHNLDWFEVVEQRGRIVDGKVSEYQVTVKIGFRLD